MNKIVLILSLVLMSSFCLCTDKTDSGSDDLSDYDNNLEVHIGENGIINIPLKSTINESDSTTFTNTTDSEIARDYKSGTYKIIYFDYDKTNMTVGEANVVLHIASVIGTFNTIYPYVVVDDTVYNSTADIEKVKNSNITLTINISKGLTPANIEKYNNTYIIKGNSLEELEKAETRFVIAMFS
uniref:Uncharacterized protein n=1 Tax=Methanococcus maripaludis (strain C6 / ATCC BAA-1332) TaxID=444158 RepID=A9AAB7_METM6